MGHVEFKVVFSEKYYQSPVDVFEHSPCDLHQVIFYGGCTIEQEELSTYSSSLLLPQKMMAFARVKCVG